MNETNDTMESLIDIVEKMEIRLTRKKVMEIAWVLYHEGKKQEHQKGSTSLRGFSKCLKIAWKLIKKWTGKANERVEVDFITFEPNLNGHLQEKNFTYGIIIR
jgi:hypothetical protein